MGSLWVGNQYRAGLAEGEVLRSERIEAVLLVAGCTDRVSAGVDLSEGIHCDGYGARAQVRVTDRHFPGPAQNLHSVMHMSMSLSHHITQQNALDLHSCASSGGHLLAATLRRDTVAEHIFSRVRRRDRNGKR